jgi:ABC-2 type transport system ATP-binding protein
VASGTPATLGHRDHAEARIRYRAPDGIAPPEKLAGTAGADGYREVRSADLVRDLNQLTGWALEAGVALEGLEVARPTLEDVYLRLTGEGES